MSAVSKRFTPASTQISTRRRASSACTLPIARKRPSPPSVIVPKLRAETSRPLAPRNRYSIVGLLLTGYPTAGRKPKNQKNLWHAGRVEYARIRKVDAVAAGASADSAFHVQPLHFSSGNARLTPVASAAHPPNSRVLFWTVSC